MTPKLSQLILFLQIIIDKRIVKFRDIVLGNLFLTYKTQKKKKNMRPRTINLVLFDLDFYDKRIVLSILFLKIELEFILLKNIKFI